MKQKTLHEYKHVLVSGLVLYCLGAGVAATTASNETAIGIDLGTTYSAVGVYQNGQLEILTNSQGNRITPSYVAFANGERLIGDAAKNQMAQNPENTIMDVKRLIGRRWDEISDEVKRNLPYTIKNHSGMPVIEVQTAPDGTRDTFTPEQISAMILGHMRDIAADYLGHSVTKAVITVPAYFNDAQRQATRDAGTIAGLDVIRIINEPTAAAIAYGMSEETPEERNVLVFDLGGGTFDVSVLTIDQGVFEVLATGGNTKLGGEDFDERVMKYFVELIKQKHGKDLTGNVAALARLRRECERAKRALSSTMTTTLLIEQIVPGVDIEEQLTRAKFEQLNDDLFKETLAVVKKAVIDSKLTKSDLAEVVIVGGSTRIPKIQKMLRDFFDGKELAKGINPDEAVAHGAAIHAAVLTGNYNKADLVVIDTTPLSIGISTVGDIFQPIVRRNTQIPVKKSQVFSTAADNQVAVTIAVYEGERTEVRHNRLLGKFTLEGINPALRGQPQIDVELAIDANGILTVSAKDKDTGNEKTITIKDNGKLSEEAINEMIEEAKRMEKEDAELRERRTAYNEFEQFVYQTKNRISSLTNLPAESAEALNNGVEEALDWLGANSDPSFEETQNTRQQLEDLLQTHQEELNASEQTSREEL